MRNPGFVTAKTPKPQPYRVVKVGKGTTTLDEKPMEAPAPAVMRRIRHATCADHVEVDGLREGVCIPRGADPDAVVAEARDLAGLS